MLTTPTQTDKPQQAESWWRTQSATIALLEQTCTQLTHAEQRIEELENIASTDSLTGLMNRRGFEHFFNQEIARLARYKTHGSLLIIIDLDDFKEVNDTFGHAAGDACLKQIANILSSTTRATDAAARIGGDEFVLLLTQTDTFRAAARIEDIRKTLNSIYVDWNGTTLHFGASFGYAPVKDGDTFAEIYCAADSELYIDKTNKNNG